jgi:glycosyltransferase involved in cell wall biosynthesis
MTRQLTLGIPVYNGLGKNIRELIESILSDKFTDFTLLISDNGSSDGTPDVLRDYANQDNRVQLNLFPTNQGVQRNFAVLVEQAETPLFKWCAIGDFHHPDYVSQAVSLLRLRPDAVLAHCPWDFHSNGTRVEQGSHPHRRFDERLIPLTMHPNPRRRVLGNLSHFGYGGHNYAVIRTPLLQRLGGHLNHAVSDRVVTSELAAIGPFAWLDQVLWTAEAPDQEPDYRQYGLLAENTLPNVHREVRTRRNAAADMGTLNRLCLDLQLRQHEITSIGGYRLRKAFGRKARQHAR